MNVGEVWKVSFPFEEDNLQSKERPAIIIDVEDDELEVLSIKVTTHEPRDEFDIPIFKWQNANLIEPSFARVSKVVLIKKTDFIEKFGELEVSDFSNISKAFKKYLNQK